MTTWTERAAAPATSWTERSSAPATSWTERSAAPTTILVRGQVKFFKRSDNFYEGAIGKLNGESPAKLANNFFELAGTMYPGLYSLGFRQDDFIQSVLR